MSSRSESDAGAGFQASLIEGMDRERFEAYSQQAGLDGLLALFQAMSQQIAQLQDPVNQLRQQLGQNSRNSSKPPPATGIRNPPPKVGVNERGRSPAASGAIRARRSSNARCRTMRFGILWTTVTPAERT
ncbi:DUF6444 domain-containing protein [Sulfobacillus thermosulfidooxidans]|uniref:DUF6444 domain-containing protein n=1 Tax=Sulfobacillus thermosulfidooxidans TaxID=28034 RepID=UPI0004751BD2|nr:DUF6444 domain-containing protein [Sulfobacillus thermosulfidooxidans]